MGEAPSAVFPSLEEVLAAMDGRWEREHPAAELLRGAQLQARVHLLYRILELTVLQVAADGAVTRDRARETAAAAHGLLDIDINAVVAATVGTDLAEAAGGRGDRRAQGLAWVIDEIAARRADLCLAYLSGSSAGAADTPFATACRYYTRFATSPAPAVADDGGVGAPAVASAGASPTQ
ncbi:hypothetical protein [Nocardia wallacei]|uniref:hypothetical protein n=1 Tax=Nocardia wallacei TaxID=480035 RepID=UPI002457254A|nr:hypothetical protein [Nocardia wallacei]